MDNTKRSLFRLYARVAINIYGELKLKWCHLWYSEKWGAWVLNLQCHITMCRRKKKHLWCYHDPTSISLC